MRHTPGFYGRLVLLVVAKDVVRGGVCLVLMIGLLVADVPLWLALGLPFAAYPGLWLVTSGMSRVVGTPQPRTDAGRYAVCLKLRQEIRALARRIDDAGALESARRISVWIDKILGVIAEDEKYQASLMLLDRLGLTRDLLAGYLKVATRGFAGAETRAEIRANLATLETAYERFWERLNRDAIVNLKALNESIDVTLTERPVAASREESREGT